MIYNLQDWRVALHTRAVLRVLFKATDLKTLPSQSNPTDLFGFTVAACVAVFKS